MYAEVLMYPCVTTEKGVEEGGIEDRVISIFLIFGNIAWYGGLCLYLYMYLAYVHIYLCTYVYMWVYIQYSMAKYVLLYTTEPGFDTHDNVK